MKTLGQKRVDAEFNPNKNELVDQIKNKSAELIDLLEKMKPIGTIDKGLQSEIIRSISIAQTNYETACMYAVKSIFKTK